MGKNILVVDDELKIRELFYDLFSVKGYKIITAAGGEEGVKILKSKKIDLVLLDMKMPQLSGIDTLKKMREISPKVKVIMLTALEDPELDRQARHEGATGLMRKSWGITAISKIVNSVIDENLDVSQEARKRILIVDDDEEICILLGDFLKRKGFSPIITRSGEEALEKVKSERPIIVLLDMNMPGMDGLMALKKIKEANEATGVIVITGSGDENIALEAMKLGIYDYLIKPVNLDYLLFSLISKIILRSA
ncbi:MAG: response regulator [Candidatus Omnitrophica bacterium]|nr:response regulator [Candidatus Omnitrophota bacterium]